VKQGELGHKHKHFQENSKNLWTDKRSVELGPYVHSLIESLERILLKVKKKLRALNVGEKNLPNNFSDRAVIILVNNVTLFTTGRQG